MSNKGDAANIAYWMQNLAEQLRLGVQGNRQVAGAQTNGNYQQAPTTRPGVAPSVFGNQVITDMRTSSGGVGVRKMYDMSGREILQYSDGSYQTISPNKTGIGDTGAGMSQIFKGAMIGGSKDRESKSFIDGVFKELMSGASLNFDVNEKLGRLIVKRINQNTGIAEDIGLSTALHDSKTAGGRVFTFNANAAGVVQGQQNVGVLDDTGFVEDDAKKYSSKQAKTLVSYINAGKTEAQSNADRQIRHDDDMDRKEDRRWRQSMSAIYLLNSTMGKMGGGMEKMSSTISGALSGAQTGAAAGPWGAAAGAIIGAIPGLSGMIEMAINKQGRIQTETATGRAERTMKFASIEQAVQYGGLSKNVAGAMMRRAKANGISELDAVGNIAALSFNLQKADKDTIRNLAMFLGAHGENVRAMPMEEILSLVGEKTREYLQKSPEERTAADARLFEMGARALGGKNMLFALKDYKKGDKADDVSGELVEGERTRNVTLQSHVHQGEVAKIKKIDSINAFKTAYLAKQKSLEGKKNAEEELDSWAEETAVKMGLISPKSASAIRLTQRLRKDTNIFGKLVQSMGVYDMSGGAEILRTLEAEERALNGADLDVFDKFRMGQFIPYWRPDKSYDKIVQNFAASEASYERSMDSVYGAGHSRKRRQGKVPIGERAATYDYIFRGYDVAARHLPGVSDNAMWAVLGFKKETQDKRISMAEDAFREAKKRKGMGDEVSAVETILMMSSMLPQFGGKFGESKEAQEERIKIASDFIEAIGGSVRSTDEAARSESEAEARKGATGSLSEETDDGTSGKTEETKGPSSLQVNAEVKVDVGNIEQQAERVAKAVSQKVYQGVLDGYIRGMPGDGRIIA